MSSIVGEMVFSEQAIKQGVSKVASQLNPIYEKAVVISVVPGGMLFTADLVRQLRFNIKMDYISCPHTPGDRHNNSEIVFHQNIALKGADVILIDDAIESGGTMRRLVDYLQSQFELNSLAIATLLVKPSRVDIPVEQYFAYEMDSDDLILGYGLPWDDECRNLPYIAKVQK